MNSGRTRACAFVLLASAACGKSTTNAKSAADVAPSPAPESTEDAHVDPAHSDGSALFADALHMDAVLGDAPVKLDGILREWPARVGARDLSAPAPGLSYATAIQYDETKIFVAGEVTDPAFIRTARFGEGEDHASLTIAFPTGEGRYSATEIAFYAGKPGESEGSVRFASGGRKGQSVPGAAIVEAEAQGGYTFEAVIPWSTFAEAHLVRVGLRGVAKYYDADAPGSIRTIASTSAGDATHASSMPALPTEPERSLIEGLLAPKGLANAAPKFDIVADINGDAMKERVAVYDHFLTICGPHYRGGKEFFFRDLGGDLVKLEARPLTGRDKNDLVLWRHFIDGALARDRFEVWSLLGSDEPATTFAHEIAIASGSKRVANAVHATSKQIEIAYEPAVGWDASTFLAEPAPSDAEPILLPWGAVRSQVFRFDGKSFVKSKEIAQTPAPNAATPSASQAAPGDAVARDVPTPTARPAGDLAQRVLDQYKADHNVAAGATPRIDLQVQLSGDAKPERLVVFGRDIVVFGPGYLDGKSYTFLTLQQFDSTRDIKDVSVRDITGDGNADIIVRGVRHVAANGGADDAVVTMETMFIYEVRGSGIARIFSIETARERGDNRVQGMVQFIPSRHGRGFDIDVRPGIARGWNEKTYPWSQDAPGAGALEPLLLPWGKIASLRYAWNGSAFAR